MGNSRTPGFEYFTILRNLGSDSLFLPSCFNFRAFAPWKKKQTADFLLESSAFAGHFCLVASQACRICFHTTDIKCVLFTTWAPGYLLYHRGGLYITRWWQLKHFWNFHPNPWRNDPNWLAQIFHSWVEAIRWMGWSHQVNIYPAKNSNTLPKTNSSPLKSYLNPIGSRIVFLAHHFSGVNLLLNFGGGSWFSWHILGDRLIPLASPFEFSQWDLTNVGPTKGLHSLKLTVRPWK